MDNEMENQTDMQLVLATNSGNRGAFDVLVERYYGMIVSVANHKIGHNEVAHDLAQEAVLQAFISLKQLRDPSRFRGWLYGITLNVCRDFLRMQQMTVVSLESLKGGIYIADHKPSPEAIVERIELRKTIEHAIGSLTKDNRDAVMLYYYEGFSTREVAQVLDISLSAVKTRLYKARQQLKIYLEATLLAVQQAVHGVNKMIGVKVMDVMSQTHTNDDGRELHNYQVILFDKNSRRALLIWIGETEAIPIAIGINHAKSNTDIVLRPITQQFIASLVQAAGGQTETIEISKLDNDVFFATVRIKTESGNIHTVDARPSDAIGLAVWNNIPIYVAPDVWEKASPPIPNDLKPTQKGVNDILHRLREEGVSRQLMASKKKEEWEQDNLNTDIQLQQITQRIINSAFE